MDLVRPRKNNARRSRHGRWEYSHTPNVPRLRQRYSGGTSTETPSDLQVLPHANRITVVQYNECCAAPRRTEIVIRNATGGVVSTNRVLIHVLPQFGGSLDLDQCLILFCFGPLWNQNRQIHSVLETALPGCRHWRLVIDFHLLPQFGGALDLDKMLKC